VNTDGFVVRNYTWNPSGSPSNWLTRLHGFDRVNIGNAPPYSQDKADVYQLLHEHIIIGHTLGSDYEVNPFILILLYFNLDVRL
jgi:hypothetical protein